jgi:hypothetical protein
MKLARLLVALHALLMLALLAAAVGIWRIRCESFGCMGIGVAWFGWTVAFFVVLGVGGLARLKARGAGLVRIASAVWWLQLLVGGSLAVAWGVKTVL